MDHAVWVIQDGNVEGHLGTNRKDRRVAMSLLVYLCESSGGTVEVWQADDPPMFWAR